MHEAARPELHSDGWMDVVLRHVAGLRYGVIQIVVHDARVVQIERTEKVRLNSATVEPHPAAPQ